MGFRLKTDSLHFESLQFRALARVHSFQNGEIKSNRKFSDCLAEIQKIALFGIWTRCISHFSLKKRTYHATQKLQNKYHLYCFLRNLSSTVCQHFWYIFRFIWIITAYGSHWKRTFLGSSKFGISFGSALRQTCSFFCWLAFSHKVMGHSWLLLLPNLLSFAKRGL